MNASPIPVNSIASFEKPRLQALINALKRAGYRVMGPQLADGAVVYGELDSIDQLPLGVIDHQDGGTYRVEQREDAGYFDHVVGPHSLKQYLFPPQETLQQLELTEGGWQVTSSPIDETPLAVIGPRSCDLHAVAIQDRVFLEGPYVDPAYRARRERLFIVSVQCRRAAATCFCHSMKTGPKARSGFDLALTELDDRFVVEVGSQRGGEILANVEECETCSSAIIDQSKRQSAELERSMQQRSMSKADPDDPETPKLRQLDTTDIHDLLLDNLNHPRWEQVAQRCLSCANCTMVCPTCFCSSVGEVTDLTGEHVQRERTWTSCFTAEHSFLSAGPVRNSTAARYRQWLTHKLATWIDQFDSSGCVGCGRCITWCPVGIDLTEEIAAIRESTT